MTKSYLRIGIIHFLYWKKDFRTPITSWNIFYLILFSDLNHLFSTTRIWCFVSNDYLDLPRQGTNDVLCLSWKATQKVHWCCVQEKSVIQFYCTGQHFHSYLYHLPICLSASQKKEGFYGATEFDRSCLPNKPNFQRVSL